MSQENVAVVERYWKSLDRALERHWARGGPPLREAFRLEGLSDLAQPDTEWISTWAAEPFRGEEQLLRASEDWVEAGDEWRLEAEELIPGPGDRVLSVLRVSIRGAGSGVAVEQRLYTVCGIRDGKIARIHDFLDRDEALEAAGLSG